MEGRKEDDTLRPSSVSHPKLVLYIPASAQAGLRLLVVFLLVLLLLRAAILYAAAAAAGNGSGVRRQAVSQRGQGRAGRQGGQVVGIHVH